MAKKKREFIGIKMDGDEVIWHRKAKGMSQESLAGKAKLLKADGVTPTERGLSTKTIQRAERSGRIKPEYMLAIATALNVNPTDIIKGRKNFLEPEAASKDKERIPVGILGEIQKKIQELAKLPPQEFAAFLVNMLIDNHILRDGVKKLMGTAGSVWITAHLTRPDIARLVAVILRGKLKHFIRVRRIEIQMDSIIIEPANPKSQQSVASLDNPAPIKKSNVSEEYRELDEIFKYWGNQQLSVPVTVWLSRLKSGKRDAVKPLWDICFPKTVQLARDTLGSSPRAVLDEEDVALDAFTEFCDGMMKGELQCNDESEMWRILSDLTVAIARNVAQRASRDQKVLGSTESDDKRLMETPARGPTPEEMVIETEYFGELFNILRAAELRDKDDWFENQSNLRQVAMLTMEGKDNHEIARMLKISESAVRRKLEQLRKIVKLWRRENT